MKKLVRVLLLVPVLAFLPMTGCGSDEEGGDAASATDTLTRRQKDSLISTMPIPGSGAVGKALRVSDSLAARAERHDTLLNR